jgi:hypothetical protein
MRTGLYPLAKVEQRDHPRGEHGHEFALTELSIADDGARAEQQRQIGEVHVAVKVAEAKLEFARAPANDTAVRRRVRSAGVLGERMLNEAGFAVEVDRHPFTRVIVPMQVGEAVVVAVR